MGEPTGPYLEDFTNLCRICLQTTNNATYLFSDDEVSKQILDKIYLCFQIILTSEKHLPSLICHQCSRELDDANSFRQKCLSFEERFTSLCEFGKKENNVDETENLFSDNNSTHAEDGNEYEENSVLSLNENDNSQKSFQCEILTFEERFTSLSEFVRLENNADGTENLFSDNNLTQTEDGNEKEENSILSLKDNDNSQKSFQCEICNKILKSKVSLLKHKVSMHQERKHIGKVTGTGLNRRYHCIKCPYSTPHSQTLVNHMRKHNGEKPYHCDCGKSFAQSSSLAAHQKIHTNLMEHICSICGKQLKHAFSLKKHQRVHEDPKFSCNLCEKTLKSRKSLKDHMNRHYNVKNYSCEDCGDTFVSHAEMWNHRKTHDQERKFECHLCDYKTRAKRLVAVHVKRRHAGEKPHRCNICNKATFTAWDLRQHQNMHTQEKPYPCPVCTRRFATSNSVNSHMHTIHGLTYKWGDLRTNRSRTKSVKLEKEKHELDFLKDHSYSVQGEGTAYQNMKPDQ